MGARRKITVQRTDYYPYGEPWREPAGQPWLYSGNERLRLDGINEYDFNARRFNSVEGRFSSWDAMNEKYPWLSPYAYCGGDPVNYSDPSGLKINCNPVILTDKVNKFEISSRVLNDLTEYTGLNLSYDENNYLVYEKNEDGSPMINSVIINDKEVLCGSKTARNLLITAIEAESTVSVAYGPESKGGHGYIQLNHIQINGFIAGANKLDGNTLGYGMIFLHELLHTDLGGNLRDKKNLFETGKVVDTMNKVRNELSKQGYQFGKRLSYPALVINGWKYIPFNKGSLNSLQREEEPESKDSYIKHK